MAKNGLNTPSVDHKKTDAKTALRGLPHLPLSSSCSVDSMVGFHCAPGVLIPFVFTYVGDSPGERSAVPCFAIFASFSSPASANSPIACLLSTACHSNSGPPHQKYYFLSRSPPNRAMSERCLKKTNTIPHKQIPTILTSRDFGPTCFQAMSKYS